MDGTGIQLSFDNNFESIIQALDRMSIPKMQELAEYTGEKVLNIVDQAFSNEETPDTFDKWESSLRAELEGGLTLTDTSQLRRSIIYEAFPDGSLLVGSNLIYSRIHQKGGYAGKGGKVKIPERRYLGIPSGFISIIMNDPVVKDLLGVA